MQEGQFITLPLFTCTELLFLLLNNLLCLFTLFAN